MGKVFYSAAMKEVSKVKSNYFLLSKRDVLELKFFLIAVRQNELVLVFQQNYTNF